ncbi:L-arabinose isomerase [Aeromicrobium wangtongii]|uniref:L-arabinose isomerase n=1 Tax=Aeromicrobium wangtongii TaxID=2969247 RepID=UPI002018221E|nr:L-arabinose isomerase [Aeromicrobium wangtongii]MCL3817179.1 L-arabinose isomerase [Aeromicrobium wangtongii]
MISTVRPREVWFLTGSQGLYGEQTLQQVAEQSREVAAQIADDPRGVATIVWKPVLTSADAIRRVILEANADDDCVGLIGWMHTFSPAKMWIQGLTALQKPFLHLHTQWHRDIPWSTIDMDFMNLNQAAHGDREFGFVQTRLGVARKIIAGHVSDPSVGARIATWSRAALGAHDMRTLRLARFGDNMRDVAVTEGDKVEAQRRFGVSVNTFGVNDLVDVVDRVEPGAVDKLVAEYCDQYDIAPDLRVGAERHELLRDAAQIEVGLRQFLVEGGYGAFTTNFEDLGGLRQLPGIAVQRLMTDGFGFGGEGDWKTSILVRTTKTMAAGLPGGTSFMEDYTYHLEPGRQKSLGAHMLEVCPSISSDRPRAEAHPLSMGNRQDPVRLRFIADPGEGVVVGLSDLGDRFRLTANDITLVEPDEALPQLPVACAVWQAHPSLPTAAESWLMAGGPHHTVLTTAVGIEAFDDLAEILRTELAHIDQHTTPRQFVRELRWNQAYYRLAEGF